MSETVKDSQETMAHFTRCYELIEFAKQKGWSDDELIKTLWVVASTMSTTDVFPRRY